MANRVGPIPPEKGPSETSKIPGQDRATSKGFSKVKETEAIDPDEQRGRRFQQTLDRAEEQLKDAKNMSRAPSPFAVYQQQQRTTERPLPPTPRAQPPQEDEESPLPQSDDFWRGVDEPPDQKPPPQNFQETSSSDARQLRGEQKKGEEIVVPGKPEKEIEKRGVAAAPGDLTTKSKKQKKGEPAVAAGKETKGKKEEKEGWIAPEIAPPSKKLTKKQQEEELAKFRTLEESQKREGEKKKEKHVETIEHSGSQFPPNIAPVVQAATTQATPYLSQEALHLFTQMVGTILVLASRPGVTSTQVLLNSPAFANSRFFGATITIDRYATAPNAINIRLSGSNEAVAAFNQNLSKLTAALDRANLPFQVNRLEAVYATKETDRPVFRRKEPGEKKGDLGGGFEQKKGG